MRETIEIAGVEIPTSDWDATPASVKVLVNVLYECLSHIEEQLNQSSQNSSRPPSTDKLDKEKHKHKPDQDSAEDKPPKKKKKSVVVPVHRGAN